MIKKVTGLLGLLMMLAVLDACRCDEVEKPYYDFNHLMITESVKEDSNTRIFYLQDEDRVFLASRASFQLIGSAYATQPCPTDGDDGRKFQVTAMEVTSDAAFDEDHPAGGSLNDLFAGVYYSNTTSDNVTDLLANITSTDFINSIRRLELAATPTGGMKHTFTVTVTKSNGAAVDGSIKIDWQEMVMGSPLLRSKGEAFPRVPGGGFLDL